MVRLVKFFLICLIFGLSVSYMACMLSAFLRVIVSYCFGFIILRISGRVVFWLCWVTMKNVLSGLWFFML